MIINDICQANALNDQVMGQELLKMRETDQVSECIIPGITLMQR